MTQIQLKYFQDDILLLKSQKEIKKSSKLATLAPFLDEKDILRVGGRIQKSSLPFEAKHPILLPYNDPVTTLIMTEIHKKHLHVGPKGLLALTRQKYWPLRGKQLATKIVHSCNRCFRINPRSIHQFMGSLPQDRVTKARTFENIGIDFLGPIQFITN